MLPLRTYLFPLLLLAGLPTARGQQLIVNEFSQGNNGAREYIELVVAGTRTCGGDSCMDIRGWIIDDNNGWCGSGSGQGIATGHMRFTNDPNWSCVPYGAIILLYNSGDLNPSITLPDDPTDANNDNVYVVPSNTTLLEHTTATPVSPSSAGYVYPATAYAAGGNWGTIGLANGGDAVIVTAPSNPAAAHYSIAYGSVSSGTATVYKSQSGAARVYYLTDGQFNTAASYAVGNAPADETPGAANNAANAAWIAGMLANPGGTVHTNISACINPGESYPFDGTLLTTGGLYHDTLLTASGCDSILHLTLQLVVPQATAQTLTSCNPIVFNGVTYTSSAAVSDTLFSALGCDSVYRQTNILIQDLVPSLQRDTVSGCQEIVYEGIAYTVSQEIVDTVFTSAGCDSIYKRVYLNIVHTPVITLSPADTTICQGQTVTLSASSSYPLQWVGYPQGPSITVSPGTTTSYVVQATNELNCAGTAVATVHVDDFRVRLDYSPRPAEKGETVTLTTSSGADYSILAWEPAALFSDPAARTQELIASQPTFVEVTAVNKNGCTDTAALRMEVLPRPSVFLPSAFSPNGDGLNDYFCPRFTRDYHIKDFSVYNRWGQRVYSVATTQQLGKGWDGYFNGTPCELGTYYYLLRAENTRGEEELLKGDILLVR